jgi:hypothetical protein
LVALDEEDLPVGCCVLLALWLIMVQDQDVGVTSADDDSTRFLTPSKTSTRVHCGDR